MPLYSREAEDSVRHSGFDQFEQGEEAVWTFAESLASSEKPTAKAEITINSRTRRNNIVPSLQATRYGKSKYRAIIAHKKAICMTGVGYPIENAQRDFSISLGVVHWLPS